MNPKNSSETGKLSYTRKYGTITIKAGFYKRLGTNEDKEWSWIWDSNSYRVKKVIGEEPFKAIGDYQNCFKNFNKAKSIDLSGWDTSAVTNMREMFYGCKSLEHLDISKWDTSSVTDMWGMFLYCSSLEYLDLSEWDTSSVTDMCGLFNFCSSLKNLDLSEWDTSSVKTMETMIGRCSSLKNLDLSRLDTSSVTHLRYMFTECSNLEHLDISSWNTSSAKDIDGMFENCSSLKELDLSQWNTSSVTSMVGMFKNCSSLDHLDLSQWDISSVRYFGSMFKDCSSLEYLNLSRWAPSFENADMSDMFKNCTNLKCLNLSPKLYEQLKKEHHSGLDFYRFREFKMPSNILLVRKDVNIIEKINLKEKDLSLKENEKKKILYNKELSLKLDEKKEISYKFEPENPIILPELWWKSENPEMVSVDKDGMIEGHKPGKTTIIVYSPWWSSLNNIEVSAKLQVEVLNENKAVAQSPFSKTKTSSQPSSESVSSSTAEIIQNLKELALLRDNQILSDEEFNQIKSRLLARIK